MLWYTYCKHFLNISLSPTTTIRHYYSQQHSQALYLAMERSWAMHANLLLQYQIQPQYDTTIMQKA
jgi:hypothetical protein